MSTLKRELNLWLLAVGFLTRVPITATLDYSAKTLNASSRYFTLVGLLLGLSMAAVYAISSLLFPATVSVLLVLIANLLLTGCFHQDGLADMADGFGGAFKRERKLEIMKDSRLGTYGSSALIMVFAMHYCLLLEIETIVVALLVGQSLSRCLAASIIFDTPYAADPDASKAKPLSQSMDSSDMFVLLGTAILPVLLLPLKVAITVILVLLLMRALFKRFIVSQIGGYTGDCLGAAQQISESCIYLTLLAWQGTVL